MAAIIVKEINVLDNPGKFLDPFKFEISFECVTPITDGTYHNYSH
jgi:histone chaperone ASF1